MSQRACALEIGGLFQTHIKGLLAKWYSSYTDGKCSHNQNLANGGGGAIVNNYKERTNQNLPMSNNKITNSN